MKPRSRNSIAHSQRRLDRRRWLALASVSFLSSLLATKAQQLTTDNPDKIKTAYLLNFVRYATWPAGASPGAEQAWVIGIVGNDSLAETAEKTLQGHQVRGHGFKIVRASKAENLPSCQIAFLGLANTLDRQAALSSLRGKPVLTVGDAPEFLAEGGAIRFRTVSQTLRMDIDLASARAAQIEIDTKMIEVAYEVWDGERAIKRR